MKVEIDGNSGFCGGVIRAIGTAERYLAGNGRRLYSLGAIVHNEEELFRLESLGLVTISGDQLATVDREDGEPLLIRAHGEPPSVYAMAAGLGFSLMDCTCPVVLRLQKDIREAYGRLHASGGSLVIYGKKGHPEVLGLVGQVDGEVLVVQDMEQVVSAVEEGLIRTDRDVELFSQTTMSPDGYAAVCDYVGARMRKPASLSVHNTICRQVASRHRELVSFASSHDVIVFVSGLSSSNGKVLCDLCRRENPRTYHICSVEELEPGWFGKEDSVGVCGATSTPKWLLEKVAAAIENLQ